jgi:hypothetical protein
MASNLNRVTKALRRHHPTMRRAVAKKFAAQMCRNLGLADFHRICSGLDYAPWRGGSAYPAHPMARYYPA